MLADLSHREGIEIYPAESDDAVATLSDSPFNTLVADELRLQLGANTRVAESRNGLPGLWVSFNIAADEYWVRIPADRMQRRIALQWLGWTALALALALLAAYLIVSRIGTPLRRSRAEARGQ